MLDSIDIKKIEYALKEIINERLRVLTISKPLGHSDIKKIQLRPIKLNGAIKYQESRFSENKVYHDNLDVNQAIIKLLEVFKEPEYGQLEAELLDGKMHVLVSKKGTVTIKAKKSKDTNCNAAANSVQGHNRTKNYILSDGTPVDFLVALGVQMPDGKVVKAKYDKFRQINKYLEFVKDVLPSIKDKDVIKIVDFGCGKSYLTFALYYYLKVINDFKVDIIGLDLKSDVIDTCNKLKDKLGYKELRFMQGNIKDYNGQESADMVVTLHACDTATDYAIAKAIGWNASVIMTVPCCQHELNGQIKAKNVDGLESVLKYGIIKERMSALITDAYRGNCLEQAGYDVQIMEFIDMEHTPKNILIRAVKSNKKMTTKAAAGSQSIEELKKLTEYMNVNPTLAKLLEL